ncbi:hypothetical protein [Pseudomonas cerasi]
MKAWFCPLILQASLCAAVTPIEISRDLQTNGHQAFARKITDTNCRETLHNISAGNGEWIALAPELVPVMGRQRAIQQG